MKALLATVLLPWVAAAQTPPVTWAGIYHCAQGVTALTLTVQPTGPANEATALFHFKGDRSNPGVPEGCFAMSGTYDARHIRLHATGWLLQPPGYVSVDVAADVGPDGRSVSGTVIGPGCDILTLQRAKRDADVARCRQAIS